MTAPLILASASPFRRELLARLRLAFTVEPADIDETARPGETPSDLVARLAREKADAVFARRPDAAVIGSDQVADLDGRILGKPGSRDQAIAQLRQQAGRTVIFRTGLCLLVPDRTPQTTVINVETRFRALDDTEIARYVDLEAVTATAGSIKAEGLGISLVEHIRSDDPTALIGLPLITLCRMLRAAGYTPGTDPTTVV